MLREAELSPLKIAQWNFPLGEKRKKKNKKLLLADKGAARRERGARGRKQGCSPLQGPAAPSHPAEPRLLQGTPNPAGCANAPQQRHKAAPALSHLPSITPVPSAGARNKAQREAAGDAARPAAERPRFIYFHLFSSLPGKGERSDTRPSGTQSPGTGGDSGGLATAVDAPAPSRQHPWLCPHPDTFVLSFWGDNSRGEPWQPALVPASSPHGAGKRRNAEPLSSPPAPLALRRRRADACQIRFQHPGSSPCWERQESPARGRLLQLAWSCTAGTGEPAGTVGMEHGASPQLPGRPPCPGCLPDRGIPTSPAQQLPLAARMPSIPSSQRG